MPRYRGRGTHGQVVEELGRRIVGEQIPIGATLDLGELGHELDVSLSVLRETVKVLTAKGLLDARQKRGTFVRPREEWNLLDSDVVRWTIAGDETAHLIRDLDQVRMIIEPAAARLAAEHADAAVVDDLDGALAAMAEPADAAAAARADVAFHRTLLRATGNEILARMDVFLEPGLTERDLLVHASTHDDPTPSHRRVVEAVRAGDGGAAEQAMLDLLAKASADAHQATAATAVTRPDSPEEDR